MEVISKSLGYEVSWVCCPYDWVPLSLFLPSRWSRPQPLQKVFRFILSACSRSLDLPPILGTGFKSVRRSCNAFIRRLHQLQLPDCVQLCISWHLRTFTRPYTCITRSRFMQRWTLINIFSPWWTSILLPSCGEMMRGRMRGKRHQETFGNFLLSPLLSLCCNSLPLTIHPLHRYLKPSASICTSSACVFTCYL